jgi:hypothetical protein
MELFFPINSFFYIFKNKILGGLLNLSSPCIQVNIAEVSMVISLEWEEILQVVAASHITKTQNGETCKCSNIFNPDTSIRKGIYNIIVILSNVHEE